MTTQHGWQPCRACHQAGQEVRVEGDWHLRANPGYWGAQAPKVLVLGFSKGATQIAAAVGGQFDAVAFAGMRPRLKAVLDGLGLDLNGQSIDEALSASGRVLGAASLIRCGLSVMEQGQLKSSGTIMPKAAKAAFPLQAMKMCIGRHLKPLPESVETVVMLGTTDAYVKGVKGLMREQFPDYQDFNDVAFRAQGRTWVFASHPSGANGTFGEWVAGDGSTESGRKRLLALAALGKSSDAIPSRASAPARALPTDTQLVSAPLPSRPMPLKPTSPPPREMVTTMLDARFAQTFHLVSNEGRKVVPVRMKNQDSGLVAFRLAKMGNTKDGQREVTDEAELLRLCETGQYQVRAQPLDKSGPANFVRPLLNHRIVKSPAA
ncbi:hypothetical protein [Pseudoxanthomonas sp. OG2]|uniref:hypothetical protein n=1 Tax=Pseudoxanthomonas sp. OG2 TaxID=2587011 RepID=UPI00161691C9|nr:hypothetical protein [Pseudoxanthomonas sp. OG2]MBB3277332.1 hypothetical protein [Pseudoxanthomonas sp. OG2]